MMTEYFLCYDQSLQRMDCGKQSPLTFVLYSSWRRIYIDLQYGTNYKMKTFRIIGLLVAGGLFGALLMQQYFVSEQAKVSKMNSQMKLHNSISALNGLSTGNTKLARQYLENELTGTLLGMSEWSAFSQQEKDLALNARAYLNSLSPSQQSELMTQAAWDRIEHLYEDLLK